MSSPSETDALIELLIQLQKIAGTVPDQAKALLTAQPPLAFSLIKLMVKMNILSPEVLQKTLTAMAYPSSQQTGPPPIPPVTPGPPPISTHSNGVPPPSTTFHPYPPSSAYQSAVTVNPAIPQSYIPPPPTSTIPQLPTNAQAMLAAIPEDQRNMVLQILSYTPEQINQLAPSEKATFIQLLRTVNNS
ncbi:hypothetical protein Clacol_007384 [Clathrus columnatus]|uniref:Cleavage stimulation factor subunit 2 hinge domain-containing protein n=1 Tax=Clathrus columnatus TaxID=1419009 RepID=A0AAV5AKB5_9AGAM|nr:hypothetical protein Clacol_007384 [Clathrus columnatus]